MKTKTIFLRSGKIKLTKKREMQNKTRALFGIFPVWLDIETSEIWGFWSDIALFFEDLFSVFVFILSFGEMSREYFRFFPYPHNDCKNWFQAIARKILFLLK